MSEMQSCPPVIIIGMHRSGTTLVTRLLEAAGLFMGVKKEQNQESIFFLRLNRWIMSLGCATWDHPEFIDELLCNNVLVERLLERLRMRLNSPQLRHYLGWKNWLVGRRLSDLDARWAWKDPRNTYTLPLWLKLFPDAQVIHVYRHGVDVANSLVQREKKILRLHSKRGQSDSGWRLPTGRMPVDPSPRCQTMSGAFSLWEAYMERADQVLSTESGQALAVCYEKLLLSPQEESQRIFDFLDLSLHATDLRDLFGKIKADRAFAYKQSNECLAFAKNVQASLARHGYGVNGWE